MREIEAIEASARDAFISYTWPGNVRELRNVVEFAHVMGKGPVLMHQDLPPELLSARDDGERLPSARRPRTRAEPNRALDREMVAAALDAADSNRVEAAHALGISRTTLWRRMRELGLG